MASAFRVGAKVLPLLLVLGVTCAYGGQELPSPYPASPSNRTFIFIKDEITTTTTTTTEGPEAKTNLHNPNPEQHRPPPRLNATDFDMGNNVTEDVYHNNTTVDDNYEPSFLLRNCSYVHNDVFCDCDLLTRRFLCYNIQSVADIREAFNYLLNVTHLIYWQQLEVHCIEPYASDEPAEVGSNFGKSFHISYEMFTDGPRFETIIFLGDCSKPKHYDNLIAVDRDVQSIIMVKNMLRMATSCSLLQPKFERLNQLVLRDCLVAGDMISSTFSTRCLGQYGTRNEPLQLTRLTIAGCNISLVEPGAFHNFAELELIDLSNNQISHLSRQAFAPHLYRLRSFRFEGNRLSSLNAEFFEKLPELREVNLAGNRLVTLPMLSNAGPGVAQVLHLAGNAWDCRCRLTWLLEEPIDSVRFIADEPRCAQPSIVRNKTLFKGLHLVKEIFC